MTNYEVKFRYVKEATGEVDENGDMVFKRFTEHDDNLLNKRASYDMTADGDILRVDEDGVKHVLKASDVQFETEYVEFFSYNLSTNLNESHLNATHTLSERMGYPESRRPDELKEKQIERVERENKDLSDLFAHKIHKKKNLNADGENNRMAYKRRDVKDSEHMDGENNVQE
jgi:hypothetical protein